MTSSAKRTRLTVALAYRATACCALAMCGARAHAQGAWPVGAGAQHPPPRNRPADDRAGLTSDRLGADAIDMFAVLLADRDSLGLSPAQVARVALLKARRDSVVRPLWAAVDSLAVVGDASDWQRLTDAQRAVLRDQLQRHALALVAARDAERAAREGVLGVLTELQRAHAESLAADARRALDDALRKSRNGGWGGFGGKVP